VSTEATVESPYSERTGLINKSQRLFAFFGGRAGTALFFGTIAIAVGLFVEREHLSGLGSLGYVGVGLIAFLGNIPIVPVFPWILLIVPLIYVYPTWALVVVSAIGAGLGELIPYFLGKNLSNSPISNRLVNRLRSLPGWARILGVFLISLSPVFSCPGLVSGVLRVRLWMMTTMKVTTEALKLWLILEAAVAAKNLWL
jgi:membrane protein YqaA with SNARE-associated domain